MKHRHLCARAALPLALFVILAAAAASPAFASDRRFTYTYETGVLAPGQVEFEPWVTWRNGRENHFNRFDLRLEFEVGVTDWLQMALYLNSTHQAADNAAGTRSFSSKVGFAWEWKAKFLDPVADPIGLGAYFELKVDAKEVELEEKILIDKRFGDFVFAFNIYFENKIEFEDGSSDSALFIEFDLALAYFLSPEWSIGVELRNKNAFPEYADLLYSALFAGPVVAFSPQGWWMAFTIMLQLPAIDGATQDDLVLNGEERFQLRLIVGFDL